MVIVVVKRMRLHALLETTRITDGSALRIAAAAEKRRWLRGKAQDLYDHTS